MARLLDPIRPFLPKKFRQKPVIIPAVRLSGAILSSGGGLRQNLSLANVAGPLKKAFSLSDAPAVALLINSPGGSPVQSNLIFKRIRALAEENEKKVIVAVEDVAASGGYMLAVAGDEIVVDPSSIIGSIGVVSAGFGFTGLIDKIGVERRVYTAGKNKVILDPFQPENNDDIEYLKGLQEEIHETFVDLVKSRRGDVLSGDEEELFSGRFWTGQTAQSLGLVDRVGDIRSIVKESFGKKAELKVISAERGFLKRTLAGVSIGGAVGHNSSFGSQMGASFAKQMINEMEERALWARYGL